MSRVNNKEKYKEYDHNYYIKHKRPKSKIGQAELKIADLEAKLAEKENEIKTLICDYESRITKTHELMSWLEHENEELKQQLDEKDTRIAELEDKDWYEACIKQLEEQNNRLIDTLKEKDKEIERLNHKLNVEEPCLIRNYKDMLEQLIQSHTQLEQEIDNLNAKITQMEEQDMIFHNQLAIQELEKAKDLIKHFCDIHSDEYYGVKAQVKGIEQDVCESIDNQIKILKGE